MSLHDETDYRALGALVRKLEREQLDTRLAYAPRGEPALTRAIDGHFAPMLDALERAMDAIRERLERDKVRLADGTELEPYRG